MYHPSDTKRLYQTGDLMVYNSDGSIRFMGRRDHQVKLRGQRVELQEVEFQVRQAFDDALEVVTEVIIPQEVEDSPFLAAFLQIGGESKHPHDVLICPNNDLLSGKLPIVKSRLLKALPTYMVPAVFLPVSQLPLGATGKLDRKRLRQLVTDMSRDELQVYRMCHGEKRMPSSGMTTEALLQQLWAKTLNIPQSSIGKSPSS